MGKSLTKATFGIPSTEVLAAIDASDKALELQAATYRFQAKMAELERQFQVKAPELRSDYLHECEEIQAS
jgi:hypothetical protein